ncbi:hypothetical protein CDD82_4410 [Ophiocordyceps australis]|uniref:SPX domain-containing protein n=1 Tax=Ophiocordyceps australis TaxID=1399860 RepID=A0A2C5Z678_9HYPO|nr:hypothetical protein CDD82_4410 [Ophiocordyceps australis]
MKYGQQLVHQSVPEWSLHNLDYNSLKHEIKAHTTRDQATAMAIPGHQDVSSTKFEDNLYSELVSQHDRVDLFVMSKADEISRRLEHLNSSMQKWVNRYQDGMGSPISLRRQRRFAKYERVLLRCRDDIVALSRFAGAQVTAFRKILKKYRKWTGSTTLSSRFNQNILNNPKSFTRRDFGPLHARHDDILAELRAAAPRFSGPSSPSLSNDSTVDDMAEPCEPMTPRRTRVSFDPLPPVLIYSPPRPKYWNEYDDGSDTGGAEDEYAIYIDPDHASSFPGLAYARAMVTVPYQKARKWLGKRRQNSSASLDAQRPLLAANHDQASAHGYSSTAMDAEDDSAGNSSPDRLSPDVYAPSADQAIPTTSAHGAERYRERVLGWGTTGSFVASFVLLAIASILMATGKRRLRVEVNAGVTVGVVASLFCACMGLGMTLYRRDKLTLPYRMSVWSAFVMSCLANGMLLILVLGNTP